jgi:hypothetical protein
MPLPNIYALTDTRWNNAGVTYNGIWLDVNNGAGGSAVGAAASRPFRLSNNGTDFFNVDLFGNLKLGADAAGTPTAQTISVGNVSAGTSNTAGADWTFNASQGTGTGAGGRFIFQVAAPGGAGNAQNALINALTIDSFGNLFLGTGFGGVINFSNAALHIGCVSLATFSIGQQSAPGYNIYFTLVNNGALQLGQSDAAAPVAQTLGVQNVVAGTSNTAGANWTLKGSAGTGTGIGGDIVFQIAPAGGAGNAQNAFSEAFRINNTGTIKFSNAASFSANGIVATVLGSLGPAGAHTTVQEWLTFVNSGGTTRYVACF